VTQKNFSRNALIILTVINYLNYIDRYILAAVLSSIKVDLNLSDYQAGLLATAFMLPYIFCAPLFGYIGDTKPRHLVMAAGVALWSFATAVTGLVKSFHLIMFSRFCLGVGESAFTTISIPYISDLFPAERRGRALAIFSAALPVGAALGYVLGGVFSQTLGWRMAFFIVGVPGILMAYLVYHLKDAPRSEPIHHFKFKDLAPVFLKNGLFIFTVLGYCAYTFTLGGIAHWIPTYIQRYFLLSEMQANAYFGGIAVFSGISGTLLGGYLGDMLSKKSGSGHLKISAISSILALPFMYACFKSYDFTQFMVLLFVCEFLFFLSTSPINVAIMHAVPSRFKTTAMALSILACHLLGDAISSPLIGQISDATGSLNKGMMVTLPAAFLAGVFWFIAVLIGKRSAK
jgi:predicted MFS family arabinose efflux permease